MLATVDVGEFLSLDIVHGVMLRMSHKGLKVCKQFSGCFVEYEEKNAFNKFFELHEHSLELLLRVIPRINTERIFFKRTEAGRRVSRQPLSH